MEKLEWFTIFVSVENWTPAASQQTSRDVEATSGDSSTLGKDRRKNLDPENDIPVENLKLQLGFTKQSKFILEHSKLPFLRSITTLNLWGNRNVLETSCHVDNWIALCAGEQTSYMVQNVPWMEQKLSWKTLNRDRPAGSEDCTSSIERVVQESTEFENCRFLCQMAVVDPEYSHFDKSISFLGCSMEMLRSSLAKWAEKNDGGDEASWKTPLFNVHGSNKSMPVTQFDASAEFTSCLQSLHSFSDMSKRFVKMRVLWELQNHFQTQLPKEGTAPSNIKAIALCILSFPAVFVDAARPQRREDCVVDLQIEDEQLLGLDAYGYVIRASSAPQDLKLCVSFKAGKIIRALRYRFVCVRRKRAMSNILSGKRGETRFSGV